MHTETDIHTKPSLKRWLNLILVAFLLFFSTAAHSQCAMCRAVLESSDNTEKAQAVNDGIVYLMVIPYVLVAAVGFAIYRSRRNQKA